MTMIRFLAITVAMLAACGVAATQAAIQDGRPLVTASWCKKAPAIDGKMLAGEWDEAAQVTGFVDGNAQTFAKRQCAVRVMCDDTHLYLAFTSPVPDGASLVAQVKDRDGLVWLDDAIELFLSPDGKAYYQIVGNSAGVVYDAKGMDVTWDGRVRYASGVQAGRWVAEMSIPYASIGVSRPVDGETWRLNFARDLKKPEEWTAWSASTQLHNIESFGYLTFRHAAPVVVMDDCVMSTDGTVSVKATVCGPASRAASVDATLAAASTRGPVLARSQQLKLAGGKTLPVELTADLVDTDVSKIAFTVTDVASGELLARTLLAGSAPLAPSTVELKFAPLEYQHTGWVQLDISRMKRPLSKPRAVVELLSADAGVLMAKTTLAAFTDGRGAASLNLAGVRPGKYRLMAKITGANGTGEVRKDIELIKPPDAWVGNKIGITSEVLPPWTPMEVQGSGPVTVTCWGREYRFSNSAFPAQITTQGGQILSAPVRLIARQGGRALQSSDQTLQLVSSSAAEVRLSSHATIGGFQVTTKVRMEYDGLMVFDVTLTPGVNHTLDRLTLEIPLKSANARYMHVTTTETLTGAGYVCGATGSEPAWTWQHPFSHFMWMGDDERGLGWFAESMEGWGVGKNQQPLTLERHGETMRWVINLIQETTQITGPRTITFGLHPTPVKPLPPGWRGWGIQHNVGLVPPRPNYTRYFGYPEVVSDAAAFDGRCSDVRGKGQNVIAYSLITMLSGNAPEYQYYNQAWLAIPGFMDNRSGDVQAFGGPIYGICAAVPEWRDFIVWKEQQFMTKNKLDGLYLDNPWPWPCANELHGCNGRVPILAVREIYKRVYAMAKGLGRPTYLIAHASGGLVTPYLSFCDAYMTGEQFGGTLNADYFNYLDWYRAEAMGKQWGLVPMLIPETPISQISVQSTEGIFAVALLHDAGTIAAINALVNVPLFDIWAAVDAFGIAANDVEFMPYWTNRNVVQVSDKNILVSLYKRGSAGALVVVANSAPQELTATVTLNLAALGFPNAKSASDARTKQLLPMTGGRFQVTVARRNMRLIQIE